MPTGIDMSINQDVQPTHCLNDTHIQEIYTIGHNETRTRSFLKRKATGQESGNAGFFSQHLRPGMNVLDCGCGPGSITAGFAEIVAPGEVLGIDVDATQLQVARSFSAERGLSNVRFEEASIYQTGAAEAFFDGAHCQYVLEFLQHPLIAIKEIYRALKPGSIVGLTCADYGGRLIWPVDPNVEEAWDMFMRLWRHNGGDPHMGRKLPDILAKVGFTRIESIIFTHTYGRSKETGRVDTGMMAVALSPHVTDQMIALGWTGQRRIEEMRNALLAWSEYPGAFHALTSCRVLGWEK